MKENFLEEDFSFHLLEKWYWLMSYYLTSVIKYVVATGWTGE